MLTRSQLENHLVLQDQMNCMVNPEWLTANYAWHRAIYMETAEYLEHVGWKWWKAQDKNLEQARLELVDIWHFILSHHLVKAKGSGTVAAINIADELKHPDGTVFVGYHTKEVENLTWPQAVDAFVSLAAGSVINLALFGRLMDMASLTWEHLHTMYVAKNVLNIFRQMHGYKDGTYIKTWQGKEDNEVLSNLVTTRPEATPEQLFAKLEQIYATVLEQA